MNQSAMQWQTARIIRAVGGSTTPDTLASLLEPTDYVAAKAMNIMPHAAIGLRFFGLGANTDTAIIRVTGWMDPNRACGPGPGRGLLKGTVTLSGQALTSAIPLVDGKWGAAANWREGVFATTGGYNGCGAVIETTGDATSEVLMPTRGYNALMFEIASIGGASQATDFGILARTLANGWVIAS